MNRPPVKVPIIVIISLFAILLPCFYISLDEISKDVEVLPKSNAIPLPPGLSFPYVDPMPKIYPDFREVIPSNPSVSPPVIKATPFPGVRDA